MKKYRVLILFLGLAFMATSNYSCSRKTGCKINDKEELQPKTKKDGSYKRSKTKSGLFKK